MPTVTATPNNRYQSLHPQLLLIMVRCLLAFIASPNPPPAPSLAPNTLIPPAPLQLQVVPIYMLGGAAYLRRRSGATGLELVPNRDFWASLPGLIKDGAGYVRARLFDRSYEAL